MSFVRATPGILNVPTMSEAHVLSLFESPGKVETATPGATVWLARDPASGRSALVKKLAGAQAKARVTAALALKHPAIVSTRRWLLDDGALYVIRDVPRGKNLRQVFGPYKPEPEALKVLALPLLDALEYAHARGAPHGGLSLENVLRDADGHTLLCDFGTADPSDPRHKPHYAGVASAEGDIRAAARLLADLLPTSGSFGNAAVRARIEGIFLRCDSLSSLRETLAVLDRLAAAPVPKGPPPAPPSERPKGPPPLASLQVHEYDLTPEPKPIREGGIPYLEANLLRPEPVLTGSGGLASLEVRNEGDALLTIRMVATQHAWLAVRPTVLPISIPPGATTRIGFLIAATRLSPGDYRSEIYLSTNAGGPGAEDLRGGWFKHTFELRAVVVPSLAGASKK